MAMELDFKEKTESGFLPAGWEMVTLKSIVQSNVSGFSCNKSFEEEDGYVHLRTHNVNTNGKLDFSKIVRIKHEKVDERKNFLKKGDILFNNTNSQELVGKTAFVDEDLPYGYSNHLNRILVKKNADPKFIVYYLNQLQSSGFFAKICNKWVGQAGVNMTQLMNLEIPLPPLAEQQRIVAKLDALFTRIDEAIALTEGALKSIQNLLPAALDEVFGQAEEKGWEMKSVKDLSTKIQYGYTGKTCESGKWKYLRITDIQAGAVAWANVPFVGISDNEAKKYFLTEGDIVFARTGATAGKSFLIYEVEDSVFASYLIRIVSDRSKISPAFLYAFFQSSNYWQQVQDKTVGAAQPNVNGQKLGEIMLPVPSFEEQVIVVAKFDRLVALQAELEKSFGEKSEQIVVLKQNILKEALEGQL